MVLSQPRFGSLTTVQRVYPYTLILILILILRAVTRPEFGRYTPNSFADFYHKRREIDSGGIVVSRSFRITRAAGATCAPSALPRVALPRVVRTLYDTFVTLAGAMCMWGGGSLHNSNPHPRAARAERGSRQRRRQQRRLVEVHQTAVVVGRPARARVGQVDVGTAHGLGREVRGELDAGCQPPSRR